MIFSASLINNVVDVATKQVKSTLSMIDHLSIGPVLTCRQLTDEMGPFQRARRQVQTLAFKGRKRNRFLTRSARTSRQHPWWQVMCLTGVDYFSTLGYQPGIAFLAAGMLSPIATLVLVLFTFFGALANLQPCCCGESTWRRLDLHVGASVSRWKGKLFVLVLLRFRCY